MNHLLYGEPLAKKVDTTNIQWQKVYSNGALTIPCDAEVLEKDKETVFQAVSKSRLDKIFNHQRDFFWLLASGAESNGPEDIEMNDQNDDNDAANEEDHL